jgi:hypothetical protein
MPSLCSAINCISKRSDPNVSFFTFPKEEIRRSIWLKFCPPGFMPKKSSVLCTLHFNKNDIKLTPRKISHRRQNRLLDPVTLDVRLSQAGEQIVLINVSVYR